MPTHVISSDIAGMMSVATQTGTGTTLSLTTTASQSVIIVAKGSCVPGLLSRTISLNYDGVAKDTTTVGRLALNLEAPFSLVWIGTPGALTKNVTVTTTGGTLNNVSISVIKLG